MKNKKPSQNLDLENAIRTIIKHIGDDFEREGLKETPIRVMKSYKELFCGYDMDPEMVMKTFSAGTCDQIVICKNIELYSMCEHHMLPFFGVAHVAYIPSTKVIGISKLPRLVDIFARRLQIQERIGEEVTHSLMKYLQPKGAACIIEATHMCMRMRGVEKQNSTMITSSMKGAFFTDARAREELMQLIK